MRHHSRFVIPPIYKDSVLGLLHFVVIMDCFVIGTEVSHAHHTSEGADLWVITVFASQLVLVLVTFITLLLAVAKEIADPLGCAPLGLPVLTYLIRTARVTLHIVHHSDSPLAWPGNDAVWLGKSPGHSPCAQTHTPSVSTEYS